MFKILILSLLLPSVGFSFCGFFVSKADTALFNKASKVIFVRDGNRTVMTVASDYKGDTKDFAMIMPVPSILQEGQIKVISNKVIDHLDQYSAPRLVEYFDPDPCRKMMYKTMSMRGAPMAEATIGGSKKKRNKSLGVKVEATYDIGEYKILILSAKESGGLLTWLNENKYKLPAKAKPILRSYIKQGLKFFVAKVNLEKFEKEGRSFLRPIRVAYESKRYTVPIRLGTINANGDQELFIFALTKTGRVNSTNYQVVKLDSDKEVPLFVKKEFPQFYKDMFSEMVKKNGKNKLYLEYAWNMNWCDPCAADPLSSEELKEIGVFWSQSQPQVVRPTPRPGRPGVLPSPRIMPIPRGGGAAQVYITRLHTRYNSQSFPEDIQLQTTPDKTNFQGRYILNNPWEGDKGQCEAAKNYFQDLTRRKENRAKNVANLTGWNINDVREKMNLSKKVIEKKKPWWKF